VPLDRHARSTALNQPDVEGVFDALGDPTRRRILALMGDRGRVTATELAGELDISRQAVAKHLAQLRAAGLADVRREGREARYHVTPGPLGTTATWLSDQALAWDGRVDRLRREIERRSR
jgi:ArsR family transcriptional regulator, cadmium/lead-responsive transcriptional repressor